MKSALYLLIVSLLALSGCYNQLDDSVEKSITKDKQVRINLGKRFSSRYKGSYNDVVSGGSVQLFYSLDNGTEKSEMMENTGSNWAVNLTLSVGTYTFRAEAYNGPGGQGELIFDTLAPKTYEITPQTSQLNLGLQLNPIMEDVGDTPMPVITQIAKPAGYLPGYAMNVRFKVVGGANDNLSFHLALSDNQSNQIVSNEMASSDAANSSSGALNIYEDMIGVMVPYGTDGQLTVEFSVSSHTLERSANAQFRVEGAVDVAGTESTLVFMPQAEFSLGVRDDTAANTIIYSMKLSGHEDFHDNVTFAYDDPTVTASAILNSYTDNQVDERVGELYRENMDAGTMTITFTSTDGNFTTSYDFEVPSGPSTQFSTDNSLIGGECAQCDEDNPVAATLSGIDGAVVELYHHDYIEFAPQETHDLTTDGSVGFYLDAWENGAGDGHYDIEITDGMDAVVWDSNSNDYEFYLSAGTYTIAFTAIGTINDGVAGIEIDPVHALEQDDGSMDAVNYSIDGAITTSLASGTTDTRDIYFNQQAGLLAIVQDNASDLLSLKLLREDGTEVKSARGDMILGYGHTELSSGSYQLEIYNDTGADWNGRLVAYETFGDSVVVTTPDGINFYKGEHVYMEATYDSVFVVDVSQQCMNGQVVRVYSGDPQDLDGNSISSIDDDGNTIVTSANCSQPFQMAVTAGDYLEFTLKWPPIEVSSGDKTWSYDHPETWSVYEPYLPFFDGVGGFEIKWQEPTSGEILYIKSTDPDIELGVRNEEAYEDEWSADGNSVGPIALDRTTHGIPDTSLWVKVRYVGTDDIEGALTKTINIIFQNTAGSSSNYADETGIQFEVRDND